MPLKGLTPGISLASFPSPIPPDIGGGLTSPLDWSAYQPVYDFTGTAVSVPASTWQTFVNITGKGFFKWCRISDSLASSPNPDIRLTIDGQVYLFSGVVSGAQLQGNEIDFEIPFKTSLKIEALNSHATNAANMICDYLYLLQQSNPNASKMTLLQQSQRKMAYLNTLNTTLTDVVNVTGRGYLLGIRFIGFYNSATAPIRGDITIDGAQKMTDRSLFTPNSETQKQTEVVGPIRFNSSLRIRTRIDAAGSFATCLAWYSLD